MLEVENRLALGIQSRSAIMLKGFNKLNIEQFFKWGKLQGTWSV